MSEAKPLPEPSMDEILASIRRILAEDEPISAARRPRARMNGDVLDLTEALNEDGTVRHIPPVAPVTVEAPSVSRDGRVEPVPPGPNAPHSAPRLVSDAASEAVAASFARLASLTRDDEFDGIVREALRPMLQAWLDEHLPDLVERLVKAEIARVVGASRPVAP